MQDSFAQDWGYPQINKASTMPDGMAANAAERKHCGLIHRQNNVLLRAMCSRPAFAFLRK